MLFIGIYWYLWAVVAMGLDHVQSSFPVDMHHNSQCSAYLIFVISK